MNRRIIAASLFASLACLNHHQVFAQDPQETQRTGPTPYIGVFGGASVAPDRGTYLTLFVAPSYEDNGVPFDPTLEPSVFDKSGAYTAFGADIATAIERKRARFTFNAGTDSRYYHDSTSTDFIGVNQHATAGVEANFARRTTLTFNQSISYSPAYFGGLFAAVPTASGSDSAASGGDYASSDLNALTLGSTASIGHGVSRNGTFTLSSSFRNTMFDENSGYDSLREITAGGRYQHRMTRYTTLRLGYTYRRGDYGFIPVAFDPSTPVTSVVAEAAVHDLDIGVDYTRQLSLSRRTQIEFATGSAIINRPEGAAGDDLQYRVLGHFALTQEINRMWRAGIAYSRGMGFVNGLTDPVFTDAIGATINGFLSRRVDLSLNGSYSNGSVAPAAHELSAYTGTARLRVGLTRLWATYVEYLYYNYDFGQVQLPLGVPSFRERNVGRVGLTLWLPISRR